MKILAASLVVAASLAPTAFAEVGIYSNNFESGQLGPEWSSNSILTKATNFTRFNGRYSSSYTELTLPYPGTNPQPNGLIAPPQGGTGETLRFRVVFDFFAIDTWDGDATHVNAQGSVGPDRFAVLVNGTTLFNESFNNRGYTQSFREPDVGRYDMGFLTYVDAIYRDISLDFEVAPGSSIVIRWQDLGLGSTGLMDESWGIDNVRVGYSVVPAPGSLALFGAGLLARRRRRRD